MDLQNSETMWMDADSTGGVRSVDLDKLSIRQAKALITVLNEGLERGDPKVIKRKVDGKDVPLGILKEGIRSRLTAAPELEMKLLKQLAA